MTTYTHTKAKLISSYLTDTPIQVRHEYGLDLEANHIDLFGEKASSVQSEDAGEPGVEYVMANKFIANMHILMRKSSKPILINMKTCGGVWEEGMTIYDMIKACPNQVTILNYTHARSMSSIIFQAADKRVMMPHSKFMFHLGSFTIESNSKVVYTEIEELRKTDEIMTKIYIDRMKEAEFFTGYTDRQLKAWLKRKMDSKQDVYLNAEEAVKYGFADEIFGQNGYDWDELVKF